MSDVGNEITMIETATADADTVTARVNGPSMNPTLLDGDVLLIEVTCHAGDGDIVVFEADDHSLMLGRLRMLADRGRFKLWLARDNRDFPPMLCAALSTRVRGVVIDVLQSRRVAGGAS